MLILSNRGKPLLLAILPNQDGYEFQGVRHDGSFANCRVYLDPTDNLHKIIGEASYVELQGWCRPCPF